MRKLDICFYFDYGTWCDVPASNSTPNCTNANRLPHKWMPIARLSARTSMGLKGWWPNEIEPKRLIPGYLIFLMLIPLMIIKTAARSNLTVENITIALSFLLLTDIPVGKCCDASRGSAHKVMPFDETRATARSKSSPFQCWFNSRAVQRPWNHVKMNQCAELKWWIHTNQNKTSTWNMICRSCLPLLFQLQFSRTLLDGSAQGKGK